MEGDNIGMFQVFQQRHLKEETKRAIRTYTDIVKSIILLSKYCVMFMLGVAWMFWLECSTFSYGGAGCSFLMFQAYLFQSYQIVCQLASAFKHCSVGALHTWKAWVHLWNLKSESWISTELIFIIDLTSPSLSSLMYVSSFPKPISDYRRTEKMG